MGVVGGCGIAMGNATCRVALRIISTTSIGTAPAPITTPTAITTPTPTTTPTATNNRAIGDPVPNAVLSVGIRGNATIGGNSILVVLRTVGVRGRVVYPYSNAIASIGIGSNTSIRANTILYIVTWFGRFWKRLGVLSTVVRFLGRANFCLLNNNFVTRNN